MMFDIDEILEWMKVCLDKEHLAEPAQESVNKAGIVPLFKDGESVHILLIKPHAKKKHLGAPPWQLIKGTRMVKEKSGWEDYKQPGEVHAGKLEPLLCTALREGLEEAGLMLGNISSLGPLGLYNYKSVSTGATKTMQLYALLMKDKNEFHWPTEDHPVTESMLWFDISRLPDDIRADAKDIIEQIKKKL